MKSKEQFILDTLSKSSDLYLKAINGTCLYSDKKYETMDFLALYRVDEITFEDKAPRKEALENVISSMNIEGINFVYIIMGNSKGVRFYYGVACDTESSVKSPLEIYDIGEMILKPSLQGNFRGSSIVKLSTDDRVAIKEELAHFEETKVVEGVPGINKDDEKFQAVDRLIDVMLGDDFALLLIAKPLNVDEINDIQEHIYHFYDIISPVSKNSIQQSTGENTGVSEGTTEGKSDTKGTNTSHTEQESSGESDSDTNGKTDGTNSSTTKGKTKGSQSGSSSTNENGTEGSHHDKQQSHTHGTNSGTSTSDTTGDSESETTSTSLTKTTQSGSNTGSSTTIEIVNRKVQDWIKYMDDVILPRLDYGLGKGLFVASTVLLGKTPASLIKLENTIKSVYGGENGNRVPLRAFSVTQDEANLFKCLQIPRIELKNTISNDEMGVRTSCSQLFDDKKVFLGNWMSSQEISLLAGLPQKEVVGLALKEEVDFGLNPNLTMKQSIPLGHMVQSGLVLDGKNGLPDIPVHFGKEYFDKHIFITGVTGSGKTTTCQKLLLASENNFLVIEPAKTEYRVLAENQIKDLLVFTLGKENGAPFRLNPFEFFEGENITSRVDMIKASMEAAFDMEAAIPQLLEAAIYACYEDKGWDITTNENRYFDNPYAEGVYAFPTLGDLERKVEPIVKAQGFDERLRDEYIGSIRARLKGLTVGAKGQMLNTPRSIDFVKLLDRKVVLELENIKSGSEKSLIMGFILTNLSEAIRKKYDSMSVDEGEKKSINHLTLIEEAHRLLSKYMPGDSMNKKQGVEMFADMLAEVRKYGESLIIADQIPNKLTPEVLKNTNTKIVHKIFAQDDKDAIGNTIALKDEQKEHLSYLVAGRAIMMNPGLSKAIQIQIDQDEGNNTERPPLNDSILRKRIMSYYAEEYMSGIIPGLENMPQKPDSETVDVFMRYFQPDASLVKGYFNTIHMKKIEKSFVSELNAIIEKTDIDIITMGLCGRCHKKEAVEKNSEIIDALKGFLLEVNQNGNNVEVSKFSKYRLLDKTLVKGGY